MRRKKRSSQPPVSVSIPQLTEQGKHQLERKRWRDAIRIYKLLLKRDPEGGWGAQLSQAYLGRAQELMATGMIKETLIILDNADRLTSTPHSLPLRLTCLVALNSAAKAVTLYMGKEAYIAENHADVLPWLREYMAGLLLAQPNLEPLLAEDSPWRSQLQVAREALTTYCRSPGAEVEPLLGRISLRSPFRPLRLILKAMLLVREQPDKAQKLISTIASTSPWAGMAQFVTLCAINGEKLLQQADELPPKTLRMALDWHGVNLKAWQHIQTIRNASANRQLTLLLDPKVTGSISEPLLQRAAFLLLVQSPRLQAAYEKRFGILSTAEKSRLNALVLMEKDPYSSTRIWRTYLGHLKKQPKDTNRDLRIALTCQYIAALILSEDRGGAEKSAINLLEESLTYDMENRKTHQALVAWSKSQNNAKVKRQILERAQKQFPEDADFLHEAVLQALANKTFKKASRLAKRLLVIDPLHGGIRRELIGACLSQARKQVQTKRFDLASKELAEAATWERSDEKEGIVTINQAFLCWLDPQQTEAQGAALLATGMEEAGGDLSARLRAVMEGVRLSLPAELLTPLEQELITYGNQPITNKGVLAVVRVADEYASEKALPAQITSLSKTWKKAKTLTFSHEEWRTICRLFVKTKAYSLLNQYARFGEKKWRKQPVFAYYRLVAKYRDQDRDLSEDDFDLLDDLLDQARQLKDHLLTKAIEEWLSSEDEFDDFLDPFSSNFGMESNLPEQEMVVMMGVFATKMYLQTEQLPFNPEEARKFLLDFVARAPADIKPLIPDRQAYIREVLDHLFPSSNKKPPSKPGSGKGNQRHDYDLDSDQYMFDFD